MAVLSLKSNIASLRAQRQLASNSATLSRSFERLSSGMRINRASDDSAGLAVAAALKADYRVYSQALRNANDAISVLNVAGGTVEQLSTILTRLKELAAQAANGAMSLTQRRSLDTEAKALTDEYNRLINSADFNNRKLLDNTFGDLAVQLGYGNSERITATTLGLGLRRNTGTGAFTEVTDPVSSSPAYLVESADLNGDGYDDLVIEDGSILQVRLSNGDGTFGSATAVAGKSYASLGFSLGDLNGDGRPDLVSVDGSNVDICLNNGNGNFSDRVTYTMDTWGVISGLPVIADVNNDGQPDVVVTNGTSEIAVLTNRGGGLLNEETLHLVGAGGMTTITAGDINGDGRIDLVGRNASSTDSIGVLLGTGNGGFGTQTTYALGGVIADVAVADFNHDGISDVVSTDFTGNRLLVQNGQANGALSSATAYSSIGSGTSYVRTADINADGYADLVSMSDTDDDVHVLLGNSDGTFQSKMTTSVSGNFVANFTIGDVNGDGVPDVVSNTSLGGDLLVLVANTNTATTIQRFNLTTRSEAADALSLLDTALDRVSSEEGRLGSYQSRLGSAVSTLSSIKMNYSSAESRITNVDVAQETAQMVASKIKQDIQTAVLAQANQTPSLVLGLLQG